MPYPVPEPVPTPRAREGLRAVVPTIFPPSAVNRGESVHVRSPEPARRCRPKKRGRKPKQNLGREEPHASVEPHATRSRAAEEPESRRPHPHGAALDHGLIRLTRRFQEETAIASKPGNDHRRVGLTYSCATAPGVREREQGAHGVGSDPHLRRQRHSHGLRTQCQPGAFGLAAEADHDHGHGHGPAWTPRFSNHLDAVTVTDVTVNLLTVTVRESGSDTGFFTQSR